MVMGDEKRFLPNFLAGEEEQPLEGQFDLDLELVFDTVDHSLLESPLGPDRWCHAGVCETVVVGLRACWRRRVSKR